MSEDQQTYQRAVAAALLGLAVQAAVAAALGVLALVTVNPAVWAACLHAAGGLVLWLCLVVVYQQYKLERAEALEVEQLAERHGAESSIFETSAEDLSVARNRLRRFIRWGLPLASLLTAGYLIGIGGWITWWSVEQIEALAAISRTISPLLLAFIFAGIAFGCFVVSRYLAGMGKLTHWQLLRGGAAYLMGVALISLLLTVAVGLIDWVHWPIRYLALVVPVFMVVIGAEMALNFLLDLYRPRKPGEVPRPAFDSRLLGLLTTPESVAKTINEAINYQFGFEVTRSWFWQLLSRAFGGLIVLGAVVILGLSCIVVVQPNQQAVITTFGRLTSQEPLGPGLHAKWPWPMGRARHYDVTTIRSLKASDKAELKADVPILWTNVHTEQDPVNFVVAAPRDLIIDLGTPDVPLEPIPDAQRELVQSTPSVSLVNVEIELQYRIRADGGLMQYIQHAAKPDDLLENIAQTQVSHWLFAHDIDELIGSARSEGEAVLHERIQTAADEAQLGIEVVNVAIMSIHPPQAGEVAAAFAEVVSAEQRRQRIIEQALADQIRAMAEVAGSTATARRIVDQVEQLEQSRREGADSEQLADQELALEQLLRDAGGEAATQIADARAYRWQRENSERGNAVLFEAQIKAYDEAPRLYRARKHLDVLARGMADARKYLLLTDRDDLILRFDFKDQTNAMEQLRLETD
jgi:regulator of protease activity HflC (stomatin/prohibitin superfamily)